MSEVDDAVSELLRIDRSFADSPERLGRALLDLLPHDERAVRLLRLAAELGVPALVATGATTEAYHRLTDQGGLSGDVARWVTGTWSAALGSGGPAEDGWGSPGQPTAESGEAPSADPGVPLAIRVAAWPDGGVLLATIGDAGVFTATVPAKAPDVTGLVWRRAGTVQAANSRDVAVGVHEGRAVLVWSDVAGLYARGLTRTTAPGGLSLLEPRLVVAADEPRYPVGLLVPDPSTVDIVWTVDRRQLRRTTVRAWRAVRDPTDLPAGCATGERFSCLDATRATDRAAWLLALTDRGRLLVSRWDLGPDDVAGWRPVPVPANVALTQAALAALPTGTVALAATATGALLSIDMADAFAGRPQWHSVDRPDNAREAVAPRSLAAGTSANGSWLAVCAGTGGWLARLGERDGVVRLGRALALSPAG